MKFFDPVAARNFRLNTAQILGHKNDGTKNSAVNPGFRATVASPYAIENKLNLQFYRNIFWCEASR